MFEGYIYSVDGSGLLGQTNGIGESIGAARKWLQRGVTVDGKLLICKITPQVLALEARRGWAFQEGILTGPQSSSYTGFEV